MYDNAIVLICVETLKVTTLCSDEIPALLSDWLVRLGNLSGTITKAYQRLRVS